MADSFKKSWKLLFFCIVFFSLTQTAVSKAALGDEELKEKIGQMIMAGFLGTQAQEGSEIYKIIKELKIGGVALFDFDAPSNSFPRNITSPEQTKKLIASLQAYSAIPLLVAVDAEGGKINRLKKEYGFLSILSPAQMGKDKTLNTVKKESAKLAGELSGLGFNMNLAPVVDVNINPKNPIIGALDRSFSSKYKEVVNQARVFIENHIKNNVIAAAKHFPGQGSAKKDTHLGLTDITKTYKQEELYPYQKLNQEGLLDVVMVGHVVNQKIDKKYPATMSSLFLKNILRNQIGFTGVIISDDLQMAAISDNYKLEEAVVRAVNAGCDIITVLNTTPKKYDKDIAYKVRDIIFNAVKNNEIEEKRIIESYNRVIALKEKFKIISRDEEVAEKIEKIRAKKFELLEAPPITFGEAFDIVKYVEGITKIRPAFLLAISQEELNLEKSDMCYLTNFKTGEGVRAIDGKAKPRTMKPDRDIVDFLKITKDLGKDPAKTLITCPMSFGWGGAMGPADFIPSTWMRYKSKVEEITKKPADPWDIKDAFLAMGLYLADSGANSRTSDGEWNAAMIYFSGSIKSPYTWYANGALLIAKELQKDIEVLEASH